MAQSPGYPNFSLRWAVKQAEKIFNSDRRNAIGREVALSHMGYKGSSGAANKALGTMNHYGLLERTAKGEVRISQTAVDILHPTSEDQKKAALVRAAFAPKLFSTLNERFPDDQLSDGALRSYLLRENFLDRAISPVISSFKDTRAYLEQEKAYEKGGASASMGQESAGSDDCGDEDTVYGGAHVGDLVQWESGGALQLEKPMRIRRVSEDGRWVAVEGSETGIPMNEVIVQERAQTQNPPPPRFPFEQAPDSQFEKPETGETEWMRNRLGSDTKVRLLVTGEIGPREIGKLIKLLEAQRAVLQDDDDDDA